jgi:ubiquinone/menaquinone biosynthesis C-methylase UbiE
LALCEQQQSKLPDNSVMPISTDTADWNSFGRANASQKWRRQSAAMGNDMTQAIVEAASVQPGMRVLDIACGTGEPAISLAALLAGGGDVVGVDISPAPLKIAEDRAAQRGLANIIFQQADAHHLPFAESSFDCITSRLGVMFFSDLPRALSEMHRVLKPAGKAILLVWGPMDQPYFKRLLGQYCACCLRPACRSQGEKCLPWGTKVSCHKLCGKLVFRRWKKN